MTYVYECDKCGEKIRSEDEPDFRNNQGKDIADFWTSWTEKIQEFQAEHVCNGG